MYSILYIFHAYKYNEKPSQYAYATGNPFHTREYQKDSETQFERNQYKKDLLV